MAIKINNNSYSGFFLNGEAINTIYLNGNQVFSKEEPQPQELYIQGNGDDYFFLPSLKNGDVVKIDYEGNIDGWLCGYIIGQHKNGSFVRSKSNALISRYDNNDNRSDRRILTVTSTSEQTGECFGVFTVWARSTNRGYEGSYSYVATGNDTGAGVRGKLYSVEIYRNNEIAMKYMPYYADNKTGLKDMISDNIYWSKKNTFSPMNS